MHNPQTWIAIGGAAAALYPIFRFLAWLLTVAIKDATEPLRQDIEVLRVAVFNHMQHGEPVTEEGIRRTLGMRERNRRGES